MRMCSSYVQDYFTDLIANDTMSFIEDSALSHPDKPFLAVLSFPAPHGPEDPAPQFTDLFDGIETHRYVWSVAELASYIGQFGDRNPSK